MLAENMMILRPPEKSEPGLRTSTPALWTVPSMDGHIGYAICTSDLWRIIEQNLHGVACFDVGLGTFHDVNCEMYSSELAVNPTESSHHILVGLCPSKAV